MLPTPRIVLIGIFLLFTGTAFCETVEKEKINDEVATPSPQSHTWSDEKVAAETRRLILENSGTEEDQALLQELLHARPRTHATALALLKDASHYQTLKEELPLDRLTIAWLLIDDPKSAESIHAMAKFFKDKDCTLRHVAAMFITLCEDEAAIPYILEGLKDSDEHTVNFILIGIQARFTQGIIDDRTRQTLFPNVQALLELSGSYEDAAKVLYMLDEKKAKEFFLLPSTLKPSNPSLELVLSVMVENRIKVDSARLAELIINLENSSAGMTEREKNARTSALELMGLNRSPADLKFLEDRKAESALLYYNDLQDYDQRILEQINEQGYAALTEQQRYCFAVELLASIGLDDYLSYQQGDNWKDALAGLDAMGLTDAAKIFREATEKFGKDGPATEYEAQKKQLTDMNNAGVFLHPLQDRFYKHQELIRIAIHNYVLTNKDKFRK